MRATIKITVGGEAFDMDYIVVQTRAPKAYDYGMVIRVEGEDGGTRIVAIPRDDYAHQVGRYASGMYFAADVEDLVDVYTILDSITNKLFKDEEA